MAVYNKDGVEINTVYNKDGNALANVYDKNGNPLLSDLLTVMTYNVQRWESINRNIAIQTEAFSDRKADIVGIQEWGYNTTGVNIGDNVPVRTFLANCGYTEIEVGEAVYNKNAFISKLALSDVSETTFTTQSSYSYQKCYFTFKGKQIAWFNTHLYPNNVTYQAAQGTELFNAVASEEYFIITGDFNSGCTSTSDTAYINVLKQYADEGYNLANCSAAYGFMGTWTEGTDLTGEWLPCDNIITSGNIDIISAQRDLTKVSAETGNVIDHVPLIALLDVK